ncbi:MAG TPA: ferritin [Solirubrobacteraceae bacterium]|nr:ferritin [Solirubrobacteraceae bacterium]
MPAASFVDRLNEQVAREFAAGQQYIAIAVFYDAQTLPRLASFFYAQAVEERNHALMMVQYLLDTGAEPKVPGVEQPQGDFADVVSPIALALAQERSVSDQIAELARTARDAGDYQSEQFVQWFLKEQVEEVSTMSALLATAERTRDNLLELEAYVTREHGGAPAAADPTAPAVAGGGL